MATVINYMERVNGDESPFTVGCSIDSGRASELLLVQGVTSVGELQFAIRELIGDVQAASAGNLARNLPVLHPWMPWWASGISSLRGVGGVFQQVSNPLIPFQSQISNWCLYNNYHIALEYQPRPYPIYPDAAIGDGIDDIWYPEDNGGTAPITYTYFPEWERFVDIEITPSSDSVSMQLGNLAFNCDALPPDARPFLAQPKLFLQNEMLKLTWYQVPMSYYTSDNSYLRSYRGRVNQDYWNTSSLGNYDPGSLLYLGCNIKRYTPPFITALPGSSGSNFVSYQKYANFELIFSYTRRGLGAQPLFQPTNLNYIVGGHNLNPYFGSGNDALSRTFLYTSTVPSSGSNPTPLWLSFPMNQLFTNPD